MENNTSLQQQLLEAGVHFGHLKKKWNPKMLPYIFAEKKGIKLILKLEEEMLIRRNYIYAKAWLNEKISELKKAGL